MASLRNEGPENRSSVRCADTKSCDRRIGAPPVRSSSFHGPEPVGDSPSIGGRQITGCLGHGVGYSQPYVFDDDHEHRRVIDGPRTQRVGARL